MTTANYTIQENDTERGLMLYGGARQMWADKSLEVFNCGPAETGKTIGMLHKLNAVCWKYENVMALLMRQTYKSLKTSALVSFEKKVIGAWDTESGRFNASKTPINKYGGENPQFFEYPTGSRLYLAGADNPEKILGSEWDIVGINQPEQLTLRMYESVLSRCTGRAGHMPYPQVLGDPNPNHPKHWILKRQGAGHLNLYKSVHQDNPTLYNHDTGEWTEQGVRALAVLKTMTGIRYQRLYLGLWSQAEGAVYKNYDEQTHIINHFNPPADWRRVRGVDFGYNHPFVCKWYAQCPEGHIYMYREIYMTQRTVNVHAAQINKLSVGEEIETTVCDHDREDRATLEEHGIPTTAAIKKDKQAGIQRVMQRYEPMADGKPGLMYMRDSLVELDETQVEKRKPTCTTEEIPNYRFKPTQDGYSKEEVVKEEDDGCDTDQYVVAYFDAGKVYYSVFSADDNVLKEIPAESAEMKRPDIEDESLWDEL